MNKSMARFVDGKMATQMKNNVTILLLHLIKDTETIYNYVTKFFNMIPRTDYVLDCIHGGWSSAD